MKSLHKYRRSLVNEFLYSIESCMENAILSYIAPNVPLSDLADEREIINLLQKIEAGEITDERYDNKLSSSFLKNEKSFYSKLICLQKHKNYLGASESNLWSNNFIELQTVIREIRNDSFHNKEITDDHQAAVINFCSNQITSKNKMFSKIRSVFNSHDLFIDSSEDSDLTLINFPDPDYYWHRFIGRTQIFEQTKKHLLNGRSVVNIYGPGGYGKSALVDYFSRHLADEKIYDKIIWFSDKKERWDLDKGLVSPIDLKTSIKEFEENPAEGVDKNFEQYTNSYRCLVVLDNLETMFDEGMNFIERYAGPSRQFLTTSRKMSESGNNQRLESLSSDESLQLIREINKFKLSEDIAGLNDDELINISKKLNNSPLHIKWWAESVCRGKATNYLPQDQLKITEFCFSGLIDSLSKDEKNILNIFKVFSKPISLMEISHINSMELNVIEDHVRGLNRLALISKDRSEKHNRNFILNNDIRPLLNDENLQEMQETLTIKNAVMEMNKRISSIQENVKSKPMMFYDDKSLEINSKRDAFICWQINEILFKYSQETKPLKNIVRSESEKMAKHEQVKRFEELLSIFPNDSQVNMSTSIAYNYNEEVPQALEKAKLALENSKTVFQEKKSLFFLCRLYDSSNEYSEGLPLAKKLYELDNLESYESLNIYVQFLIGVNQNDEALKLLRKNSKVFFESSDELTASKMIMMNCKICKNILYANPSEVNYQNIFSQIQILLPMSALFIDRIALSEMIQTIQKLNHSYKSYIKRSLQDIKFDSQELINELIEIVKVNKRSNLLNLIDGLDLNNWDNYKEKLDNISSKKKSRSKDSKLIKEAYANKDSFEAKIISPKLNRGLKKVGFNVTAKDGTNLVVFNDVSKNYSVGDTDYFIVRSIKPSGHVIIEPAEKKTNFYSQELTDGAWRKLKKDMIVEGKVRNILDYGAFIDITGDLSILPTGLLHIKDISWDQISSPKEVIDFDQILDLKIITFDRDAGDNGQISFGLKQLTDDPWLSIDNKIIKNETYKGKVIKVQDEDKCLIRIGYGIVGLLYKKNIVALLELFEGKNIDVVVSKINKNDRKIQLVLPVNIN